MTWYRGIIEIEELDALRFNRYWEYLRNMWDQHDSGAQPFTNISFGTTCLQVAAAYTLNASDHVLLVDSTAAARTITLPTAVGINGRRYTVKDWKGQAATNNITIDGAGSETIDGATTVVMNKAYLSYTIVSDGANWAII